MAGYTAIPRGDRHTPYLPAPIGFKALDFTGATFLMHVRQFPGDTGTPLVSLTNASAGSQGISIDVQTIDGVVWTFLQIQIDEATMEALPLASPAKSKLELAYDLHITPSGGTKKVWLEGPWVISPGVTI